MHIIYVIERSLRSVHFLNGLFLCMVWTNETSSHVLCIPYIYTVPGVVGNPMFAQWSNDTVRASWEQPDYPNGVISGYNITVGHYGSDPDQDMIISVEVPDNGTFSTDIQDSLLGQFSLHHVAIYYTVSVQVHVLEQYLCYSGSYYSQSFPCVET